METNVTVFVGASVILPLEGCRSRTFRITIAVVIPSDRTFRIMILVRWKNSITSVSEMQ